MDLREDAERKAVCDYAATWIGTPFRDLADSRGPGGGVDCAMFLVRVYVDTGVMPPFDPRPYKARWFLVSEREDYAAMVERFADRVPEQDVRPGDVVLWKHGLCHAHSGIVLPNGYVIHAWFKDKIVEVTEAWRTELLYMPDGSPRSRMYFNPWSRRRWE